MADGQTPGTDWNKVKQDAEAQRAALGKCGTFIDAVQPRRIRSRRVGHTPR